MTDRPNLDEQNSDTWSVVPFVVRSSSGREIMSGVVDVAPGTSHEELVQSALDEFREYTLDGARDEFKGQAVLDDASDLMLGDAFSPDQEHAVHSFSSQPVAIDHDKHGLSGPSRYGL